MEKHYDIPLEVVECFPDVGVYEFWDGDAVAPLVVTKDPSAMRLGALVVYEFGATFRSGFVVDVRGGFYILDDAMRGGLVEVPERDLLGISVGIVTNRGFVADPHSETF